VLSIIRGDIGPFQRVLAWPFIKLNIHPNYVSVLGLVFAIIGALFVVQQNWLLALIFFLLSPTMDLVDGTVARALNKRSNWGNYFETMIDKLVDFLLFASFIFIYPIPAVLALGFSGVSSYAKPRVSLIIMTDDRDWPAIGEHADKLALMLIGLFLAAIGFNFLEYFIYLVALISAVGSVQRMFYAKKLIKEAERKGTLLPYIKKKQER